MRRPPGSAFAGADFDPRFGFVAAQRGDDDGPVHHVHHLVQAEFTDRPRLVVIGTERVGGGREREFGVGGAGQDAGIVDAVVAQPEQV